ncbi:MAG: hypothetical protein A2066_04645 [Bacteroidetes bacterium GWB2_41_8]|nr:MAG: hypothetical protein A2066_04645 [Bacteroidetes bacterium GWB2_41_8]
MYVCNVFKTEKNMKTIKSISKVTMLIAFVAFANTLMASGNLKVNILPLTAEKAVVAISNSGASNFQISIENGKGEVVYYKETNADSKDFRKIFDFSKLEKGDYNLSVSVDGSTTERSFKIDNRNIAVGKEKSTMEPFFAYKEGILVLSYLNFAEENLSLNFYDKNDLVYSKKIGDRFNVNEGFDLTKLANGNYAVVLSTDSKSFTYNVDVK